VKTASLVLVVCSLTLWVACGSKGGGSASFSSAASLSSLQVTPAALSIATGATQQFTATGKFSDGSSKDVTSSVQWSSTAATVASVSSNGLATGVAAGVVTVTAQSGTVKGTASLTITSPLLQPSLVSLQVTPSNVSIAVAGTQQFTAKGTFSDNSTKDMTSSVTWSSSDSTFATINGAGLGTGVAAGVVTVTAQSGTVTGTASLTITGPLQQPSLVSLQVTPSNVSIAVAATQQFTAKGTFSDNSTKDMTSSVTWSSSDSTFATSNSAGLGVAVGVLTVTAQSGSVQGTADLTVTNAAANLASLTLSPLASSIPVNTTQQFTATGSYSGGSSRDLTALVSWSSSAAANATIDANGLATSSLIPKYHCNTSLGAVCYRYTTTGWPRRCPLSVDVPG
jgi:uncharacterized protein YjdB